MRTICVATCLVAAACQGRGDSSSSRGAASLSGGATAAAPPIACDPSGLTPAERAESQALLAQLGGAIAAVDELPDGYALRLDDRRVPFASVVRWAELERRCCPFFTIETAATTGATILRLTGGAGVKDFVRAELGDLAPRS